MSEAPREWTPRRAAAADRFRNLFDKLTATGSSPNAAAAQVLQELTGDRSEDLPSQEQSSLNVPAADSCLVPELAGEAGDLLVVAEEEGSCDDAETLQDAAVLSSTASSEADLAAKNDKDADMEGEPEGVTLEPIPSNECALEGDTVGRGGWEIKDKELTYDDGPAAAPGGSASQGHGPVASVGAELAAKGNEDAAMREDEEGGTLSMGSEEQALEDTRVGNSHGEIEAASTEEQSKSVQLQPLPSSEQTLEESTGGDGQDVVKDTELVTKEDASGADCIRGGLLTTLRATLLGCRLRLFTKSGEGKETENRSGAAPADPGTLGTATQDVEDGEAASNPEERQEGAGEGLEADSVKDVDLGQPSKPISAPGSSHHLMVVKDEEADIAKDESGAGLQFTSSLEETAASDGNGEIKDTEPAAEDEGSCAERSEGLQQDVPAAEAEDADMPEEDTAANLQSTSSTEQAPQETKAGDVHGEIEDAELAAEDEGSCVERGLQQDLPAAEAEANIAVPSDKDADMPEEDAAANLQSTSSTEQAPQETKAGDVHGEIEDAELAAEDEGSCVERGLQQDLPAAEAEEADMPEEDTAANLQSTSSTEQAPQETKADDGYGEIKDAELAAEDEGSFVERGPAAHLELIQDTELAGEEDLSSPGPLSSRTGPGLSDMATPDRALLQEVFAFEHPAPSSNNYVSSGPDPLQVPPRSPELRQDSLEELHPATELEAVARSCLDSDSAQMDPKALAKEKAKTAREKARLEAKAARELKVQEVASKKAEKATEKAAKAKAKAQSKAKGKPQGTNAEPQRRSARLLARQQQVEAEATSVQPKPSKKGKTAEVKKREASPAEPELKAVGKRRKREAEVLSTPGDVMSAEGGAPEKRVRSKDATDLGAGEVRKRGRATAEPLQAPRQAEPSPLSKRYKATSKAGEATGATLQTSPAPTPGGSGSSLLAAIEAARLRNTPRPLSLRSPTTETPTNSRSPEERLASIALAAAAAVSGAREAPERKRGGRSSGRK